MNIIYLNKINLKKLKEQRGKAFFLIIPITILLILTVIVGSQVTNFRAAIDTTVFGTLQEQATLMQISKIQTITTQNQGGFRPGGGQISFQQQNFDANYSQSDLEIIQALDHVESASLNSSVPITNIATTDLFEDSTYKISSLRELDATSASLYTEEDFSYQEGEPIPIILNANTFTTTYEDWGGATEISMDFSALRTRLQSGERADPSTVENQSPVKTKALEYSAEDLIGKTFTINFGGLDAIQDYKITQDGETRKFVKLTEDELNTLINTRKDILDDYWNYNKLSTPLTYTFKVVGIVEDNTNNATYIPEEFANKVMKDYIQNQLDAKIADIPTDLLDKTFLGLSFDGTEFSSTTGFGFSRVIEGGRGAGPGFAISVNSESNSSSTNYNIPGLVIKTSSDGNNTVEGIYSDSNAYANSLKNSTYITIKVDSVYNRTSVVEALNTAGYAFQDTSDFEVFNKLQSTIQTISIGLTIAFIVVIIGVVIFAMLKFVSDSRKEIGIFRAIGMKKLDVIKLFTTQALLYTFFGYVIGLAVGVVANILLSGVIYNWFNSVIGQTIKDTFNVAAQTDISNFARIDVASVGIYTALLILITLIVSLIPAYKASNISPVEAIKGE